MNKFKYAMLPLAVLVLSACNQQAQDTAAPADSATPAASLETAGGTTPLVYPISDWGHSSFVLWISEIFA